MAWDSEPSIEAQGFPARVAAGELADEDVFDHRANPGTVIAHSKISTMVLGSVERQGCTEKKNLSPSTSSYSRAG